MSVLYEYLSPHHLPEDEWRRRYGIFLDLSSRVLGQAPTFSSISYVSPLTINFYFGALTSCLRIPQCDTGFARLKPRQRRLALLEGSLTHRCKHCVGHICMLGDVFRGSQMKQTVRNGGWANRKEKNDARDHILKQIVREGCGFPGNIKEETRKEFVALFGEKGYVELTSMIAFMGWLNFIMGVLGFPLESRTVPFAQLLLEATGSDFKIDDFVVKDGQEEMGKRDLEYALSKEPGSAMRRLRANFQNVATFFALIPSIQKAMKREKAMFSGIPTRAGEMDSYVKSALGCVPNFVQGVRDIVLKRAVVYGVREVFIIDEQTTWTRNEKVFFMYLFAKKMQNQHLLADAVTIAHALKPIPGNTKEDMNDLAKLGEEEVLAKLDAVYDAAASADLAEDRFMAAAQFAYGSAGRAEQMSVEVQKNFLEKVEDPGAVIDVAGVIAFFGFIHRVTVFCSASGGWV